MKKIIAILSVMALVLCLTACGTGEKKPDQTPAETSAQTGDNEQTKAEENDTTAANGGSENALADLSKYPADFKDWTAQNIADYFQEAVDFPKDCEAWVQDHENYWAGLPVYECSGIWNADGADDVCACFITFNPDSPDTTPEEVEEIKQIIRDDKNHDYTTDEIFLGPQDHMIGHIAFSYGITTPNDKVYNDIEAAYNWLVQEMGLTPDF